LLFSALANATFEADVESFRLNTPIMSRHRWLDLFTIGDDGGVRLLLNLSILFATISDFRRCLQWMKQTFS
jgi:hypothetical protein